MRPLSIALVLLAASTAAAAAQQPAKAAAGKRPNFLVILTDDQRFDALGCAGHPILKTPNIDRLARRGVRFKNAFATTPICAASRASILTGLHERTHKFTFGTPPIAAEFCGISYPSLLKRAGYQTALIGKFGVVVPKGQQAEMFDTLDAIGWPFEQILPTGDVRHIDQIATDRAISFLRKRDPGRPFCLSISFNSPHAEDGKLDNLYPSPGTVAGLYDKVPIPLPAAEEAKHFAALPRFLQKSLGEIRWRWQFDTPEKYAKNVRAYFRMITGIDHEIGRLLAELDALGLTNDTVIVFLSDNGYFLGERGLSGKWVHFEESLRIPLIIVDPRLPGGGAADPMALNLDVPPTLLELAGLAAEPKHQGRSLVPLLRGETPGWRGDFFAEHLFAHKDIPKWEGVRGERFVYAHYFEEKYEFLHDLMDDPRELRNLAGDAAYRPALEMMRHRMVTLRDGYGGPYSPERFPTLKKKAATVDPKR